MNLETYFYHKTITTMEDEYLEPLFIKQYNTSEIELNNIMRCLERLQIIPIKKQLSSTKNLHLFDNVMFDNEIFNELKLNTIENPLKIQTKIWNIFVWDLYSICEYLIIRNNMYSKHITLDNSKIISSFILLNKLEYTGEIEILYEYISSQKYTEIIDKINDLVYCSDLDLDNLDLILKGYLDILFRNAK